MIFLAFSLLDNRSLSIILMIELFLCNKYLSFFIMVLVNFSVFLLVVFVIFCWCLCFWFSFIIPFYFFNFVIFSSCCLSSFLGCMSSCSCFFPLLLFFFLLLCFLFFITYVILVFFFLSFLLLCMYLVWLFLLLWFLSLFLLFLSLCFFFSPAPPRALEQENNGTKIFHFVCLSGILAKMSFHRIIVSFFLWWISFIHRTLFLFHVLGLSFEGVRDSLLLFYLSFVFGVWHTTFFRSNLSLVLAFFGFVVFFVRALLFCVSACVVFFYGFWFVSCQFLSSSWDCLSLIALSWCCFFYSCLGCSFVCVWVFGLPFGGSPPGGGGSYGCGQPGGVNIFFGFSHNRGVWVKTAAALGEECFSKLFSFKNPHLEVKTDARFQFCRRKRYKNRGSRIVFLEEKWCTTIYVFDFFIIFSDSKLYNCTRLGGLDGKPP